MNKKIVLNKTKCDSCNRNLTGKKGTYIGVSVQHNSTDKDFNKIYPELKKVKYNICFVCWYKSMGIKFK